MIEIGLKILHNEKAVRKARFRTAFFVILDGGGGET